MKLLIMKNNETKREFISIFKSEQNILFLSIKNGKEV